MYKLKNILLLSFSYLGSAFVNTISTKIALRQKTSTLRMCNLNSTDIMQKIKGITTRRDIIKIGTASGALLAFDSIFSKLASNAQEELDHSWTVHNGAFTDDFIKDFETTKSGLLYKDVKQGTGKYPNDGDAVTIQMVGYIFESGEKWSNTYKGIPAYQSVVRAGARENQKFMKGLNEGVKTMKRGGRRVLIIPAYLAYNYITIYSDKDPSVTIIPTGAALVCYVELMAINPHV
jgi:peptidylprolyl isomerase